MYLSNWTYLPYPCLYLYSQAERELSIAKASAADLHQKVSILERSGSGLQSEKHVESFLKTVKQQHETQIRELQSHVENLTQKFSQKV